MQISQESTFIRSPQNCNFMKKKIQHRFFLVKFAKFLRTPCFTEHLQWLLLTVSGFQTAAWLKRRLRQRYFSVNFVRRRFFDTTLPDDFFNVYLWILRSFSEHLFYGASLGNCLFHVQVAEFQPPDSVKNYFTDAFQALYTRMRSSHSQTFIYSKLLKIICEEVLNL